MPNGYLLIISSSIFWVIKKSSGRGAKKGLS